MLAATMQAPPELPPAIVRQVEDAFTAILAQDDLLCEIPHIDEEDHTHFNSSWLTRAYTLLDERQPELGIQFVRWYVYEEARARQQSRNVRMPYRARLHYSVLRLTNDGHVHIEH